MKILRQIAAKNKVIFERKFVWRVTGLEHYIHPKKGPTTYKVYGPCKILRYKLILCLALSMIGCGGGSSSLVLSSGSSSSSTGTVTFSGSQGCGIVNHSKLSDDYLAEQLVKARNALGKTGIYLDRLAAIPKELITDARALSQPVCIDFSDVPDLSSADVFKLTGQLIADPTRRILCDCPAIIVLAYTQEHTPMLVRAAASTVESPSTVPLVYDFDTNMVEYEFENVLLIELGYGKKANR